MIYIHSFFSWIVWNPNRVFFTIPFTNHPVVWYGVLFALGFLVAYGIGARIFLIEAFSKDNLTEDLVCDEKKLIQLCQKYPKLFPKNKLELKGILPLLNKYIKAKMLPYSFFSSKILKVKEKATEIADRLTTYLTVGLIVGSRLGYVFFYGWPSFKAHPLDIFKIWEGGLASHGGCLGVLVALAIVSYRQSKVQWKLSFLQILDILAIICGFLAFFIRLGNFINQEIVGTVSELPWAVIFADPMAGEAILPRHPVQLYEAFFYLVMAGFIYILWKRNTVRVGEGVLTGILLSCLFTFRFFIEFIKEHQGFVIEAQNALQMGQILSIPFVALGLLLIVWPRLQKKRYRQSLP